MTLNGFKPRTSSPLDKITLLEEKRLRCVIAFLLSVSFLTERTTRALETFSLRRNKYFVTKTGSSDSKEDSKASSNRERHTRRAMACGLFLIDSTWNGLTCSSMNCFTSSADIPQFSSRLYYIRRKEKQYHSVSVVKHPSSYVTQMIPAKPGMAVLKSNTSVSRLSQNFIPFEGVILTPFATHVIHYDSWDAEDVSRGLKQLGCNLCRCQNA